MAQKEDFEGRRSRDVLSEVESSERFVSDEVLDTVEKSDGLCELESHEGETESSCVGSEVAWCVFGAAGTPTGVDC